jgi:hypothetical protein
MVNTILLPYFYGILPYLYGIYHIFMVFLQNMLQAADFENFPVQLVYFGNQF